MRQRKRPRVDAEGARLVDTLVGDRYHMLHIIGSGGHGVVYEAADLRTGRRVAVKVPRSRPDNDTLLRRFEREGRVGRQLHHPNIARVLELSTLADGRPYLVIERLLGETLDSRIRGTNKLPIGVVLGIAVHVLRGLSAAHDHGFIHRDVKPSNVFLVQPSDAAKLLDFGASKPVDDDDDEDDLTRIGATVGTPHYMAPEQARGARDIDARVDIYGVGVTLYHALTGHRPFKAGTVKELFASVTAGRVVPPTAFRPEIGPYIEQVILRAMAMNPANRFAYADEFIDALLSVGAIVPPAPETEARPDELDVLRQRLHEVAVMHRQGRGAAAPSGSSSNAGPPRLDSAPRSSSSNGPRSSPSATSPRTGTASLGGDTLTTEERPPELPASAPDADDDAPTLAFRPQHGDTHKRR